MSLAVSSCDPPGGRPLVIAVWNLLLPEEAGEPKSRRFILKGLGRPATRAAIYRVGFDAWLVAVSAYDSMGKPHHPTQAQIEQLRPAAELPAPETKSFKNGQIRFDASATGSGHDRTQIVESRNRSALTRLRITRKRCRMGIWTNPARSMPALRFRILHERVPHETGARIFRHHHGDARVDAHHVGVVPVRQRIERIHESVSRPARLPVRSSSFRRTRMAACGRNGTDPPAAHGTTVPSIGPVAGGPPHTTYPCAESEAVMPHRLSL